MTPRLFRPRGSVSHFTTSDLNTRAVLLVKPTSFHLHIRRRRRDRWNDLFSSSRRSAGRPEPSLRAPRSSSTIRGAWAREFDAVKSPGCVWPGIAVAELKPCSEKSSKARVGSSKQAMLAMCFFLTASGIWPGAKQTLDSPAVSETKALFRRGC